MQSLAYILILFLSICSSLCVLCPKQCDCDTDNDLNRATCIDQNIVSVDIGVPKEVQVYSLSRNVISELDNFCFKEIGFTSIKILNLSYNLIFWIGLHAFSGLEQLVHLDLSNNRLRYISSDVFWDTPQLENLDLSANIFESLKNEPLIMHRKLQILNLNNCRIKFLPERLFTRLPNLKKLDISENYFVTFQIDVLRPLKKLERLELRNDYLQCSSDFVSAETWIVSQHITYNKQCIRKLPKMSEKMISVVVEKEAVDVNNIWNVTAEKNNTQPIFKQNSTLTPFEKFDKNFSSMKAFVIGLEIGLAIGIVGTYIWLRRFCSCGQLTCLRPQDRRRRRRVPRIEGDMRTNLLWNTTINPDLETPPLYRRQYSLPDRTPPMPTYGLPNVREAGIRADAIRFDRAETPPPPYNECRDNI